MALLKKPWMVINHKRGLVLVVLRKYKIIATVILGLTLCSGAQAFQCLPDIAASIDLTANSDLNRSTQQETLKPPTQSRQSRARSKY